MRKAVENLGYKINALIEMANIGPKTHRFGVDVKLNIRQPGKKKLKHGPSVKVFKEDPNGGFVVILNDDPNKVRIDAGDVFLTGKELRKVMDGIRKYRTAFLLFWNSPGMSTDELRDHMDEIDKE